MYTLMFYKVYSERTKYKSESAFTKYPPECRINKYFYSIFDWIVKKIIIILKGNHYQGSFKFIF